MDIVLRTAAIYLFILLVLRATSRRILRSATPLDLVVIFVIGGASLPAVLNNDMSLTAAVLASATVAGCHFGLSLLRMRWPSVGLLTEGTSVIIYRENNFDEHEMVRSRITFDDVAAEMRQQGMKSLDDVESIVVEHNGAITVLKSEEPACASSSA